MIRILKTNSPLNYALMFALMIVFWGFKFVFMPTGIENYETTGLFSLNLGQTLFLKYFSAFLSFSAFYLFGLLIIKVNSDLLIVENAYQSPGIIYALLSGFFINTQQINPLMFSGMLIFLSITVLMYSHTKYVALSNSFNAGLLFALAILIYPKFVFFTPLIVIVLFIVKPVNWREIVVLLMGIISLLILYYAFSWLYGDLHSVMAKTKSNLSQSFHTVRYSKHNIFVLAPVVFWVLSAIISRIILIVPKKINSRKFQTLINLTLFIFLLFFISPISPDESISIMYAPASLLLSSLMINSGKKISIVLIWGLIASIIFSQFIQISFYLSVF